MQLKEWGFEKYLPASQMKIVVAKAEKRARDEGKETIFFNGQFQISPERIEAFKKRKTVREAVPASPSAGLCWFPSKDGLRLIPRHRNPF